MAKITFKPNEDRVLVEAAAAEVKTASGLYIPDTAKEKPQMGEVIAAGNGARDETGKVVPLDVKVGDVVLFTKWGGTEVKIEGEDLLVMKESDIIAIVEDAKRSKKAA